MEKVAALPTPFVLQIEEDGNLIEVAVKPRLPLSERMAFVKSVIDGLVDIENGNIRYALKDFAITSHTISYFTNIRLPEALEKQDELICNTGIIDKILSHTSFDSNNYNSLLAAIDVQLKFEAEKLQNQFKQKTEVYLEQVKTEAGQIINEFNKFAETFQKIDFNQFMQYIPQIAEMTKMDEKSLIDVVAAARIEKESKVVN